MSFFAFARYRADFADPLALPGCEKSNVTARGFLAVTSGVVVVVRRNRQEVAHLNWERVDVHGGSAELRGKG
jgi:hypothetical protein